MRKTSRASTTRRAAVGRSPRIEIRRALRQRQPVEAAGRVWFLTTLVASAIIEEMSERLAGTMSVLAASSARRPNCLMYSSATRSCIASMPPVPASDSPTRPRPSAAAAGAAARLALRLVDLLLLVGFGLLDDALLLALGLVDLRVAIAFRGEHHRALLALGAHLLFHGL